MFGKKRAAEVLKQVKEQVAQEELAAVQPTEQPVVVQKQLANQFLVGQDQSDFASDLALVAEEPDDKRARNLLVALIAKMNGEVCALRQELLDLKKQFKE